MKLSVADILLATDGRLIRGSSDVVAERFSTDSRDLRPGDFFIALIGEKHDGHAFLDDIAAKGACGALVCRDLSDATLSKLPVVIRVADTMDALGKLAAFVRRAIASPVIGITGSNGKTTTKELAASVLGDDVLKAQASFNNLIGVSRTLLDCQPEHRFVVLELGTNHFGEIPALVKIAQPTVGVFLNVAASHTEFFGDEEGVAREKSALVLATPRAVLNADDPRVIAYAPQCHDVLTFGERRDADVRADAIETDEEGYPSFNLWIRDTSAGRVRLPTRGAHNVSNALAAAAVGTLLDVSPPDIARRLETATLPKMRLERIELDGVVFYNDAYNANPSSVRAAWEFFRSVSVKCARWIVFGEMLELGPRSAESHRVVASALSPAMCDGLVAVGRHADIVAEAAKRAGIEAIIRCATPSEAGMTLAGIVSPGDAILLKASRGVRLEETLAAFRRAREVTNDGRSGSA